MSNIGIGRPLYPITTGTPKVSESTRASTAEANTGASTTSFADLLKLRAFTAGAPEFSKHAVKRVLDRSGNVSDADMQRLAKGLELAKDKGLNDTLILVDNTAYIVSVKNSTVITTVGSDSLKNSVFTNIDGTVIV